MKPVNVLLTGCGGIFIKDTIDSLRNNGERIVNVYGAASEPDNRIAPLLNGYHTVLRSDQDGYLDQILQICEQDNIDIVIPTVGCELELFASNRIQFEKICTSVSVSSPESIAIAGDKASFLDLCEKNFVPHPQYCVVNSPEMLLGAAHRLGFPYTPIVVKVRDREGSRGFRIIMPDAKMRSIFLNDKPNTRCTSMRGLLSMLEAGPFPELIVQEFIRGTEFSTDALCDNGKVLYMTCRRNLRVNCSIPMESEIWHDYLMSEYTRTIAEKSALDGNISVDFFVSDTGKVVALECNPRISATIGLSSHAGINLVYLQVKRLLGEKLSQHPAPLPVVMRREMSTSFKYQGGGQNG